MQSVAHQFWSYVVKTPRRILLRNQCPLTAFTPFTPSTIMTEPQVGDQDAAQESTIPPLTESLVSETPRSVKPRTLQRSAPAQPPTNPSKVFFMGTMFDLHVGWTYQLGRKTSKEESAVGSTSLSSLSSGTVAWSVPPDFYMNKRSFRLELLELMVAYSFSASSVANQTGSVPIPEPVFICEFLKIPVKSPCSLNLKTCKVCADNC